MKKLSFDYSNALGFFKENELSLMEAQCKLATETLMNGVGAGNDFLGWIDLPTNYDKVEFNRIKDAAEKIKDDSEVLIVIGWRASGSGSPPMRRRTGRALFRS